MSYQPPPLPPPLPIPPLPGHQYTSSNGCGIGFLVTVLIILSPIALVCWQMYKGTRDMQRARDEFKRTVKPDELRAWVFSQNKKHPEGGYSKEAAKEWPETFPRFAGNYGFRVFLYSESGAALIWDFSGGDALKVSVELNPDGTPVDTDDREPWAKGIRFEFLSR